MKLYHPLAPNLSADPRENTGAQIRIFSFSEGTYSSSHLGHREGLWRRQHQFSDAAVQGSRVAEISSLNSRSARLKMLHFHGSLLTAGLLPEEPISVF